MENTMVFNRNVAIVGEALLLVWWGVAFLVDPITIGMGAAGSGLILLGINAARLLRGIPTRRSTTVIGTIALAWGLLDHFLALSFGASFAALLIVIGVVTLVSRLASPLTEDDK